MALLKFKGTKIFDGYRLIEDKILVTDEGGEIIDLVPSAEAGDDVQEFEGILSPGFINCHCHLELSHMKNRIPEETGLVDFVCKVVTLRHSDEEEILQAIDLAENEMLDEGIVAVGDICNNTSTIPQKGKGRIYYHNFIEASGFNPAIAEQRFRHSLEFFREYGKYYSMPIESNSIVPHAPYSVADELWERIIHFPGNHLLTIHNQETEGENEYFYNKEGDLNRLYEQMKIDTSFFNSSGKTSLQTYLPKFLANQSLILVHNVHTSASDIQYSRTSAIADQLYWCLCPNANWYISRQMPPVELFMKEKCKMVLGTDSLASNYQLSIIDEIKRILQHFPSVPMETYLQWATLNGAKALQMDSVLGSFEKGKQPGVLLISEVLDVRRLI
jgi:cytosine/adenosine deaminase-related metal-dependent hydrolase